MAFFGEDDFVFEPTLGEAMMANPIKTLILLGGVYAAGAFIGKEKSRQALESAGRTIKGASQKGARIAKQKYSDFEASRMPAQGSSNEMEGVYFTASGYLPQKDNY